MEWNMTNPPSTEAMLDNFTIGNYSEMDSYGNANLCWLYLAISMAGCVENGVVIWFLGFQIKRNPFSVYILNLASADFSFLLCVLLLSIFCFTERQSYSLAIDITTNLTEMIMLFGYNTGLYLLTAISVERCLSVLFPIWYRCRRSKHQSAIVCFLLWILAFLVTPIEVFMDLVFPAVFISSNLLHFLVFMPLMVLSSLVLIIKICKTSLRSPSSKLYLVIVSSVIIFFFLAIPMRIMYLFKSLYYSHHVMRLFSVAIFLSSLNSSVNPLIYFFVGSRGKKRFTESINVVLTRALQDDIDSDDKETDTAGSHVTHMLSQSPS